MYQTWPWGGTSAASPNSGYLQSATGQVAGSQWPAGYSQYAVTPELQQQWAAAWASQAQYAYGSTVAVGQQVPTTTAYAGAWPEGYQAGANVTGYAGGAGTEKQTQASEKNSQKSVKPEKSTEELVPKDNAELEKLNQLKAQAEQWKTLRQPASANWSYPASGTVPGIMSSDPNAATNQNANWSQAYGQQHPSKDQDTMTLPSQADNSASGPNAPKTSAAASTNEEEEFERQFNEWEKQFEAWKQQNINHPDKDAFAQYEKQWQEWRSQLLQKKEQMQKSKAERLAVKAMQEASQKIPTSSSDPNASSVEIPGLDLQASTADGAGNASQKMYYQNAPYMYMQPYMYSSNVPLTTPIMSQPFQFPGQVSEYPDQSQGVALDDSKKPLLPIPGMGDPNTNHEDEHAYEPNREERFKYSQMRRDVSKEEDAMYQNFEGLENPDMFMPGMEGDFEGEWNYNRGRGRGGNRSRGRGRRGRGGRGRWITSSENNEMEGRQEVGNQRTGFIEGPSAGEFGDRQPFVVAYPQEEFRRDFIPEEDPFSGNMPGPPRCDFPPEFPPEEHFPFHGEPPPFPPEEFEERFPRRQFNDRFPPDSKFLPPTSREDDNFMIEEEFEEFPPMSREPPFRPPFPEDFPPDRPCFDEGRMQPPPGRGRFARPGMNNRENFPHEEFEDRFGPGPGPPDRIRRMEMRRDSPYGPRDFPHGPRDFPPHDEGFGFEFPPEDMPPRMPPGKSIRPPYDDPGFGPPGPHGPPGSHGPPGRPGPPGQGPMFHDDMYFDEGPPIQFKTIDYTHRPAAIVLGEDFDRGYEFESQFNNDVMNYRAPIRPKRNKRAKIQET